MEVCLYKRSLKKPIVYNKRETVIVKQLNIQTKAENLLKS